MSQSYDDLSAMHLDVLQEIGNIGAGNAATSLSMMLNQPIDMTLPKVNLVEFNKVADRVGGAEALTYGVLLNLEGDISGMIMFLLDKDFAHLALNILMGGAYGSFEEMDEMALSAIKEIGNILAAAYVNSISELTGLFINLTVPEAAIDMAGALLSVPIIRFGAIGDKVLFIEENFCPLKGSTTSQKDTIMSHVVLFAEMDSLNLMLGKLGLL